MIEKVGDGCQDAELPKQAHYLYYQQRMSADLEEIVMPTDSLKLERFRPGSRYVRLHLAHGRFICSALHTRRHREAAALCGPACHWA